MVACAALACSDPTPAGRPLVPIEGERAESRALGFAVARPADWVFLPVSSLVRDRDERAVTPEEIYALFEKPALTPLVEMAPRSDPRPGVDPAVRLRAVPPKPEPRGPAAAALSSNPVTIQILYMRETRRRSHPELEVLADAEAFDFAGRSGARMRLGYSVEDATGEKREVEERLYHTVQGSTFWWVEMVAPAPMSPEIERVFDDVLASLRIDP